MLSRLQAKISNETNKSSMINLCLKPISIILGLVYTPMLLSYLGNEKYGLWSTILSIISWVNYCDIGIGQGLRNLLTKELTSKEFDKAKKSVSTAYVALTIISSCLLLFSWVVLLSLDLHQVFNTTLDMLFPVGLSLTFICINFILSLSNVILYALQLSERVALRNCVVQILNICCVLFLSKMSNEGSLVLMSILFGTTTMIVYVWNTVQIFTNNKQITPSIGQFDKSKIKEISNVGVKFFVIQLACIALYTVDNLLITNIYGGEAVTPFNLVYKIFNTCYAFLAAFMVPYWSKTTEALTRKDYRWINKSIKKLNIAAVLFCFLYIVVAILFPFIIRVWIKDRVDYSNGLVIVMCIYYCLFSIVSVNTQVINGTGRINCQLIIMTLMGVANIPLSIFFAKGLNLGVVGIRLATTVLMAIAAIVFPVNLHHIMKRIEK